MEVVCITRAKAAGVGDKRALFQPAAEAQVANAQGVRCGEGANRYLPGEQTTGVLPRISLAFFLSWVEEGTEETRAARKRSGST